MKVDEPSTLISRDRPLSQTLNFHPIGPYLVVHVDHRPTTLDSTRHNGYFSIIGSCRISIWYFHNYDNQQNIPTIICLLLYDNFWTDFNCSKFAHCPVPRRRIYMDEGMSLALPEITEPRDQYPSVLTDLNLVHYVGIE